MAGKVYEIAFKVAGQMSGNFAKTFKAASTAVKGFGDQIGTLNRQAADVGRVAKLRQEVGQAARAHLQAKQKVVELGNAIRANGGPTQKMAADMNKARAAVDRAKNSLDKKRASLKEMEAAAGTAGVKLADLIAKEKQLATAAERAAKAQAGIARASAKQEGARSMRNDGAVGLATTGAAAAATIGVPLKAAMEFEDKMAEIRKVVDFDGSDEMNAMGKALQEMSTRIPVTAAGLGDIMAAAGQSGIAKQDLLGFTEQAAKMAVAFDVTADEAGTMMAKWKSGMKLTMDQTYALADATNALSNQDAALASQIGEVLQRVGSLGGVMGIGEKQVAALGSAMVAAGAAPEIAATSIKKLGQALTKGTNVTKRQAGAYEALGLNSQKIAASMQKDAEGTIMTVLKAIKKLPKEEQMTTLTNLFGDEGLQGIGPLLANLEGLEKNFKLVGDSANYAGSMQKEFESRSATASNAWQLAKNAMNVAATGIGTALLPAVKSLSAGIVSVASTVSAWIDKNQELTALIVKVTAGIFGGLAAFYGLKMVIGALLVPFYGLSKVIQTVRLGFLLYKGALAAGTAVTKGATVASYAFKAAQLAAAGAMKVARLAMVGFNLVMAANPIALVVLAIAGLIAVGILLWKNWDTVKAKAAELWAKVKGAFQSGIESIKSWLANFNLFESGKKIIETLVSGIKSMASAPVEAVKGAFSKVRNLLPFSDAKEGPLSQLTASGQAIMSTLGSGIKKAGSMALTGPFEDSAGSLFGAIDTLSKPASGGAGTGGAVSVNFAPTININGGSGDAYADVKRGLEEGQKNLKKELERLLANQRRLSYV